MASDVRPLWPLRARGAWFNLACALLTAPLLLAAALTLIAFAIYSATEPDTSLAFYATGHAAAAFLVHLFSFTVTLGIAGVAVLWALGLAGVIAWLAAGTVTGALFAVGTGLISGGGVQPATLIVAALLGLALFALIRWLTGVRRR